MRLVRWYDEDGYLRQSYVRDQDLDSMGPGGMPHEPPDLRQLDWDEIVRELHNLLVERNLITWNDVQSQQNGVSSAIQSVLKRRIVALYRAVEE